MYYMNSKNYKSSSKFECSTCGIVFFGYGKAWYYRRNLCTRIGKSGNPSDYNCDPCADRIEGL